MSWARTIDIPNILRHYAVGDLLSARRPDKGFVNDNWIVDTTGGRYFLKHRHPSLSHPRQILSVHSLMHWLSMRGFPAPALTSTKDGGSLLVLGSECYELQEYIDGKPLDRSRAEHVAQAARSLGQYHTLVNGFEADSHWQDSEAYSPHRIRHNLNQLVQAWRLDRAPHSVTLAQLERQSAELEEQFATHHDVRTLVIHGDFYSDNLLIKGDSIVGVVDYDKVRCDARIVEVAEALIYFASPVANHLEHLIYPGTLLWAPLTRFLRAYSAVSALDANEADAVPDYVQCIWLQMSLQRLLEKEPPQDPAESLREVLLLSTWARANARRISDIAHLTPKERS